MANHNRATFEEETISVLGMQAVTSGRWVAVDHPGYLHPCRYVTSMQSKPWMTPLKLKSKRDDEDEVAGTDEPRFGDSVPEFRSCSMCGLPWWRNCTSFVA